MMKRLNPRVAVSHDDLTLIATDYDSTRAGMIATVCVLRGDETAKRGVVMLDSGDAREAFWPGLNGTFTALANAIEAQRDQQTAPVPDGMLDPQKAPRPAQVADAFARTLTAPVKRHQGDWWQYAGTHYRRVEAEELEVSVMALMMAAGPGPRGAADPTSAGKALGCLKVGRYLSPDLVAPFWADPYEPATDTVALANGIFDMTALLPHTPRFFGKNSLPFSYDPGATCPAWEAFLDQMLPDADSRQLIQEFTGLCLVADNTYQKALLLVGDGQNGKSTYTKILCRLLGPDNVSAVGLEKFGDRFAMSATLGKLANVISEIGEIERVEEGILKSFISGEESTFERKYQQPFCARPTARMVVSTNNLPRFGDKSNGVYRRLLIVRWGVNLPDEDVDIYLEERLALELSGIFLWALAGLRRLRARGFFLEPVESGDIKAQLRADCNPARQFLDDTCAVGGDVDKTRLYAMYAEWCTAGGFKPLNSVHFSREVYRAFPGSQTARKGAENKYVFLGVHWI